MSDQRSYDHVIWLQKWESGKFTGWEKVGRARVDLDETGVARVYSRQTLIPIGGWNGVTCTLPLGDKPKDPESTPRRPSQSFSDEELTS